MDHVEVAKKTIAAMLEAEPMDLEDLIKVAEAMATMVILYAADTAGSDPTEKRRIALSTIDTLAYNVRVDLQDMMPEAVH